MGNIPLLSCNWQDCDKRPAKDKVFKPDLSSGVVISEDDISLISIEGVDFCMEENSTSHHTQRFQETTSNLVVRRGQEFYLKLELSREFRKDEDALCFIFSVLGEEKPSSGNGTLHALVPDCSLVQMNGWSMQIKEISSKTLKVSVKSSSNSPVTAWKFHIDTKVIKIGSSKTYEVECPIFILFNPWCEEDIVYLHDEDKRQEYVLEDTTLIYRGSHNRISPTVWNLGQFDKNILQCSFDLISKIGRISASYRGDPIRIARVLSAVVNSPDDNGVLEGNWGSEFPKGKPPFYWRGSVEILQEFYKTWSPVKYGQCWVFAGVVTTIARALGIPSRVVTNFSSAHDTEGSMTIDHFVNHDEANSDSVWNFHVWNEVWMKRPDLGNTDDYSGWQAIDSTPQEVSNGIYQCGPASVKAVKNGDVLRPYDGQFLFAEINADRLFWRHNGPDKPIKLISKDTTSIGQFVSTKAVGQWQREDITHEYKYQEKSQEERNVMLKVLKTSQNAFSRYYLNEHFNEVHFDMELKDDVKIGEKFTVVLKVSNKSETKIHQAQGLLSAHSVLYNGKDKLPVKNIPFEIYVRPYSTEFVVMEVDFNDYYKKLLPQAAFKISCSAQVQNTDFDYFAQSDFRVRKPDIKIEVPSKLQAKKSVDVTINLENPLPIPIKKGFFYVEGAYLTETIKIKVTDIKPRGNTYAKFSYTPPVPGTTTMTAKFHSKELDDVDGFTSFEIQENCSFINTTIF